MEDAGTDSFYRPPSGIQADEIASLPVDVLIEGETGVGKDAMARLLHRLSGRKGNFVPLNCAAVPDSLAEAELFGVEAGAYTGAARGRPGRIEAADQGTLYLDEIDSMPLALQAKMLRVLQERGSERLGSTRFVRSDFRVIASTKAPLKALVTAGSFRRDLYYRLNVVYLRIPALRHRPGEVLALFRAAVDEFACSIARPARPITLDIEMRLAAHDWPGNIRELRAAACRHVLGLPLLDDDNGASATCAAQALRERVRWFERLLIERTLSHCGGSASRTSEELQMSLPTLYYRMRVLGVGRPSS